MAQLEDVGAYTNTSDVIFRFYPALISGLAYYLSIKYFNIEGIIFVCGYFSYASPNFFL